LHTAHSTPYTNARNTDIEEVLDSSDDESCEQLEEREQSRTEEGGVGRRGKAGRMRLNEVRIEGKGGIGRGL
jgi:hypothetical protein